MKIKEGGGMDIKEQHNEFFHELDGRGFIFQNKKWLGGCFEDDQLQVVWEMWQAAKAQERAKLKLLLCNEHLEKCESPTGIFNSQYHEEEPCLICLAKEAKAQAVPDQDQQVWATSNLTWRDVAFKALSCKVLKSTENWVHVKNIACVGSTTASLICKKLGVDPDGTKFELIEAQEPAND